MAAVASSHSELTPAGEELVWATDYWREDKLKITYVYHPSFGKPICKQTSGEFHPGNDGFGGLVNLEVTGDMFWFVNGAPCYGFHLN